MTFEQYKKRKEAIAGWYDTYVNETYTKLSRFGHLMEYHLNKSDRYLMGRCKRIHKNTSSFVGTPEDVMALIRAAFWKPGGAHRVPGKRRRYGAVGTGWCHPWEHHRESDYDISGA